MLLMAGVAASCEEKIVDTSKPIEIPVTEYSLYETDCWWTNYEPNNVIVISSNEDLEKCIACSDDNTYPAIDFSKYTLLLAQGYATNGVGFTEATLSWDAPNAYILKVTVHVGMTAVAPGWIGAYLTSKLPQEAEVLLEYKQTYY